MYVAVRITYLHSVSSERMVKGMTTAVSIGK